MKTFTLGLLLSWVTLTSVMAAEPESYTVTLSAADANLIFRTLTTLPWKDVNGLVVSMSNQITAQQKTAPPVATSASPEPQTITPPPPVEKRHPRPTPKP